MKLLVIIDILDGRVKGTVKVPPCFRPTDQLLAIAEANDLQLTEYPLPVPDEDGAYAVDAVIAAARLLDPELLALGQMILDAMSADARRMN